MKDPGLLARLENFQIGEASASLTFTGRLARENGWTEAYTHRVLREYLRFVYLAMIGEEPATPSEDVDQAWHLHLTYTRSYWRELCGDVLGRELHHGPTLGGASEGRKYWQQYEATLQAYTREFGEPPPADIWPPAAERFDGSGGLRWVDTRKHLLLPRPRLGAWAAGATGAVVPVAWLVVDAESSVATKVLIIAFILVVFFGTFIAKVRREGRQGRRRRGRRRDGNDGGCGPVGCGGGLGDDDRGSSGCGADSGCGGCGGCGGD